MGLVSSSFDGVPIAYELSGSGRLTIVFVHGLVGDRTDFDSQVRYFEDSYRVVGVDLAGSGESGRDRSDWTMEAFGQDVATVVKHLDLDGVVLVGHSLGGDVTVEAALRLAGRVRGLVWVSSYRTLDSVQTETQIEAWLEPFTVDFPAAMDDLNRRNFGPNADPRLVDAVATKAMSADPERVMGVLTSKLHHQTTLLEALPQIQAPVFAINPDFKPTDEASFAAHGIDLRIIPNAGHFTMMEDPQTFNIELADILTGLDQAPT
jgi:pimeloyl-ACP methyl ester carboxylesterase